jgi:hypothetical protein
MKPIPAALAAPWAIEPNWLRVVFGVWSARPARYQRSGPGARRMGGAQGLAAAS